MATSDRKPGAPQTLVRRRLRFDFSVTGLVYCAMMMFMGLAAINSQANLLFGVFGLMIGILLVTSLINALVLRKLTFVRKLPENGAVGEPLAVTYEVQNDKRFWPALSVTIAELDGADAFVLQPHAYLMHAAARTTAAVPTELIPKRRGLHHLKTFQISTSFPFGFIKRAAERALPDTLLIYPPIARINSKLLTLFRSAESTGSSMRPRRGGMDEFFGVKEYRSGEDPRYIYWRRSARTGTLVSKEMTHVSPPRLLLLLDNYVGPERETARHAEVERAIAVAASIADKALEAGLSLGLFVRAEEWLHVHPNRGKRHRRDLLSILARLPLNTAHNHQALMDEAFAEQSSDFTSVLVTPSDVRLGLGESSRGATVVVSMANPQMMSWFDFDPRVDFAHAMPADQEPAKGRN